MWHYLQNYQTFQNPDLSIGFKIQSSALNKIKIITVGKENNNNVVNRFLVWAHRPASWLTISPLVPEVASSTPSDPVSYTHLDVYKRQQEYIVYYLLQCLDISLLYSVSFSSGQAGTNYTDSDIIW